MAHLPNMVWDFEDQLHQVTLSVGTAYYVYDTNGQRVRKVIESQTGIRQKDRLYLGGFEIYRQYATNGTTVTLERESLHIMDDQNRIALVDTRTKGNEPGIPVQLIRYQVTNHLGSSSLELDNTSALISYEEYHSYGTTAFQAGRSVAEVHQKRYRYTGKERDEETGFTYHGARYYAPWLGRWLACDPLGIAVHFNLYLYGSNNPIRFFDADGKAETDTSNVDVNKLSVSNERLNNYVNTLLDEIRKDLGIKLGDAPTEAQRQQLVERISDLGKPRGAGIINGIFSAVSWDSKRGAIGNAKFNKTAIAKWAAGNLPVKEAGDKYKGATSFTHGKAWWTGSTAINPSIVLESKIASSGKFSIGTDKLGHFFAQGYQYFEKQFLKIKGP